MDHKMREFLKEYDEELYEKTARHNEIQTRVDLAERLLTADHGDDSWWDDAYYDEFYEGLRRSHMGQDDFGHEYIEDEVDPFYESHAELAQRDRYQDYEDEYDP
jgi:hypothetical protein